MTKVTNENGVFYIPDDVANDPTKTVAELLQVSTPWDEYERTTLIPQRITEIEEQLVSLEQEPDTIPNEEKFNQIEMLTNELNELRQQV